MGRRIIYINKSILKWPGGKERELYQIKNALPKQIKNYYEPFIGGGVVFLNVEAENYFINDIISELINLYEILKVSETRAKFIDLLKSIDLLWTELGLFIEKEKEPLSFLYKNYKNNQNKSLLISEINDFVNTRKSYLTGIIANLFGIELNLFLKEVVKNLTNKITRMCSLEKKKGNLPENDIPKNLEAAIKSAFYMYIRHLLNNIKSFCFNNIEKGAIYFFIRSYCYSGMFRYNKSGQFNVPYGGIGYNNNSLVQKIIYFQSSHISTKLRQTSIHNEDFHSFLKKQTLTIDDFIFLDPPYDTDFNTYNQNEFTQSDQIRLASYLINDCKAKWMLVIKNTDFIYTLYNHKDLFISTFDKKYQVSFMNRNDKNVEHLLITNYKH